MPSMYQHYIFHLITGGRLTPPCFNVRQLVANFWERAAVIFAALFSLGSLKPCDGEPNQDQQHQLALMQLSKVLEQRFVRMFDQQTRGEGLDQL